MSVFMLCLAIGVAVWALAKSHEQSGGSGQGGNGGGPKAHMPGQSAGGPVPGPTPGFATGPSPGFNPGPGYTPGPNTGFTQGSGFTPGYNPPPQPRQPPKPAWQRANPTTANKTAGDGWAKAKEETKKKEEVRKKAEEAQKKREELQKKREEGDKERARQREKDAQEARENEKTEKQRAQEQARPASPTKGHRHPTAKTATDEDAYSYRPYDEPKRSTKTATASSIYSESSYAPSQSTSRTTPPPSHRAPYRSTDAQKIIIKAVYLFNKTFTNKPISKLVSGVGAVTDGLILRITTEGLFIDDDVRKVPQREWDVKAWTLKLVEVCCPHLHALGTSSGSIPAPRNAPTGLSESLGKKWASKAPIAEESELFIEVSLRVCKPYLSGTSISSSSSMRAKSDGTILLQSGEFKGLHVLRASVRDAEDKNYVFIVQEEEGWKVVMGLSGLRRGTQVRTLGVSGMAVNETKAILESMGWA